MPTGYTQEVPTPKMSSAHCVQPLATSLSPMAQGRYEAEQRCKAELQTSQKIRECFKVNENYAGALLQSQKH